MTSCSTTATPAAPCTSIVDAVPWTHRVPPNGGDCLKTAHRPRVRVRVRFWIRVRVRA